MGALQHVRTGRRVLLNPRHLVGRAGRCDLLLPNPRVSAEHAVVTWGNGWFVRDLGSKNGTFVDGTAMEPTRLVPLLLESVVSFGEPQDVWQLVDDAPPPPSAMGEHGRLVKGSAGLLVLPSAEEPALTVFSDGLGRWLAESEDRREPVLDGDSVRVHGVAWRLSLPDSLARTRTEDRPTVLDSLLRFRVSRDEEHVQLTLQSSRDTVDLGARSHLFLLLALARARQEDAERGLPDTSQGWVYQDELAKSLGITVALLNIHVHRARSQLGELGIASAAELVERRPSTRQLRIGTGRLEIERI